jgi:hypothetical protein
MADIPHSRVRLVDRPDEAGRSTATLLASLSSRLAALTLISGADAVGSLTAGLCVLGREASRTSDGARIHQAVLASRAFANGDAIWKALGIDRLVTAPPSPVLDQLRNDLALLLADDLDVTLPLLPIPGETAPVEPVAQPLTVADYLVGLWAFAREVVWTVERVADATLPAAGPVDDTHPQPERDGPLLR